MIVLPRRGGGFTEPDRTCEDPSRTSIQDHGPSFRGWHSDRIFADVRYSAEDDTREVILTPEEIARLLASCRTLGYAELATVVRLALQTGADRGILLAGKTANGEAEGLRVRQVRVQVEEHGPAARLVGEVYLRDRKTDRRPRTVPLTDALARELRALVEGKGPDEQVFALTYSQVDFQWRRAREAAGLPDLRLKDLRAQAAIYGERARVPLTVMARAMGHGDEGMTRRYQRHEAAMSADQAADIEREMGLAA